MNLDKYYRENKDNIQSTIMEIASDLAKAQLIDKYQKPFGAFLQPEDPDNPDNGCTCYKEKYQDEFNQFYDNEYDRLAKLMNFDYNSADGQIAELIKPGVTKIKTTYATVRYDIENKTGTEVSDEEIDNILDTIWTDTKAVEDYIITIEICSRNDEGSL